MIGCSRWYELGIRNGVQSLICAWEMERAWLNENNIRLSGAVCSVSLVTRRSRSNTTPQIKYVERDCQVVESLVFNSKSAQMFRIQVQRFARLNEIGVERLSEGRSIVAGHLKGYLGNWPHYYKVVRSKLVSYNVLTNSINNTHIKRKNSKTICSSETISSRIFGNAPNSRNTRRNLCNLVGPTSLWHSLRRVHIAGSTFTFFKPANWMSRIPHVLPRQRNAGQCRR
jgi:hypothetical protein